MARAIVFDFNGIFADAPEQAVLDSVCAKTKTGAWIAKSNYLLNIWDFERGFLSPKEFWKKVFVSLSDADYEELIEGAYERQVRKNDFMFSLAKRLSKTLDIYLISNSNFLQGKAYRKQGLYSPFKEIFLSHEVREIKPFPNVYSLFLKKTGLNAKDCVFIDDKTLNVLTSIALGFRGIVFQGNEDIEAKLRKAGLEF